MYFHINQSAAEFEILQWDLRSLSPGLDNQEQQFVSVSQFPRLTGADAC